MKSFAWLVLAAVAYSELHGVIVLAQATDEIDDTITTVRAVQETILCDGTIKKCGVSSDGPVCTSLGKVFVSKCEFENSYCENPRDDNFIVNCAHMFKTNSVVDGEGDAEDGDGDSERVSDGISKSAFDVPIDIDQPESLKLAFADAGVAVESDEPHLPDDSDAVSNVPDETGEPGGTETADSETYTPPVETDAPYTDPVTDPETDAPASSDESFTDPVTDAPGTSEDPFTDPVTETPVDSDAPTETVVTTEPPVESSEPSDEPVGTSDPPAESTDPTPTASSTAPVDTEAPTDPGKVRVDPVINCDGTIRPCPDIGPSVCTSYGKSFSSYCEYENAYCENPSSDFYVLYYRPCEEKDVPFSVQSASIEEEKIWATVFDVKIDLDDAPPVKTTKIDCSSGRLACSNKYDPVCTSYGRTYMNECHFNNAYCEKPKKDFYIVSRGKCANQYQVQDLGDEETDGETLSADVMDVPIEIDEVEVDPSGHIACTDQKKPNPYCSLVCETGLVQVKPVCGSDTQSYINDCHLLSAKCENPKLEKAYDGLCVVASTESRVSSPCSAFNTQSANTGNTLSTAKPKCNPRCGKTYLPVCGSNSVTYANECLLDYASCVNPLITKLSDGKCPDFHEPKSASHNSHGSSCVPPVCSSVDAPVCGTDGETYANACLLQVAQCQNRGLSVLHTGPCDADTTLTCATLTCPLYTECREESGTQVAYCADICHPDRCSPNESCKLLDSECFTAPCSPVATCVPNGKKVENDF